MPDRMLTKRPKDLGPALTATLVLLELTVAIITSAFALMFLDSATSVNVSGDVISLVVLSSIGTAALSVVSMAIYCVLPARTRAVR